MMMKIIQGARRATTALMIGCLLLPQALWAESAIDESPNEWAMVGDLLVARPVGLVMTFILWAYFMVYYPPEKKTIPGLKERVARLNASLGPVKKEEIIALVALYRPGPLNSGMVTDYIKRKHGKARIRYPHPALKETLEETGWNKKLAAKRLGIALRTLQYKIKSYEIQ